MKEILKHFYFIYDHTNKRYLRKFKSNNHYRIRVFQSEKAAQRFIDKYENDDELEILVYSYDKKSTKEVNDEKDKDI